MKYFILIFLVLLTSFKEKPIKTNGCAILDIILAVDFSSSVEKHEKFIADAMEGFITQFELAETGIKIGVVRFNDNAVLSTRLTSDKKQLMNSLAIIRNSVATGGTSIASALMQTNQEFFNSGRGREEATKILILISDGDPGYNAKTREYEIGKTLKDNNVVICSILIKAGAVDDVFMKQISNNCYVETNYELLLTELKKLDICL